MRERESSFDLRMLLLLSCGHMVSDIYQGSLPALLPLLRTRLGLSYASAGVILLASNLTSSVIQPLFGFLSDRREKPFLLPLGCLLAGAGLSLLAMPTQYGAVLGLVILSGLGVASYHPEGYRTASYFTGPKSAAGMSIFSVGGNLGFALGPILSLAVVTRLGFGALPVMVVPALLCAGLILSAWPRLSSARKARPSAVRAGDRPSGRTWVALLLLIATVMMRSWTQIGLMTYIPFYYIDTLKGDPLYAGKLVSSLLLGGVVGTLAGSPLADRWGHARYLVFSLVVTSLLFPLLLVSRGLVLFSLLFVFGAVLISSFTVTVVMAHRLLPNHLGVTSGLMVGFAIGTGGIGVTLLGIIADRFGVPSALRSIAVLPVLGLALSLLLCIRKTDP